MRSLFTLSLIVIVAVASMAQSDGYQKSEFFVGYSYSNPEVDFGGGSPAGFYRDRIGHNGFNASAVVNVSRYFGIKSDVSGAYKSGQFSFVVPSGIQSMPTTIRVFNGESSVYNFLGGVQIKDNSKEGRVKPFAHAMIGAARRNNTIPGGGFVCVGITPCPGSTKETAFAGAFGGGVDIKLKDRFGIRLFQIDYNPIKYDAGLDNSFRFGVGVIF